MTNKRLFSSGIQLLFPFKKFYEYGVCHKNLNAGKIDCPLYEWYDTWKKDLLI